MMLSWMMVKFVQSGLDVPGVFVLAAMVGDVAMVIVSAYWIGSGIASRAL